MRPNWFQALIHEFAGIDKKCFGAEKSSLSLNNIFAFSLAVLNLLDSQ